MTSPTDKIPEDVMREAEKIYGALGRGSYPDTRTIARALIARDERAAEIALDWHMDDDEAAEHVVSVVNGTCKRIASAIRGGS